MTVENHPAYRLEEIPPAPDTLSNGAKQQWDAIVPIIFDLRTARPADLPAIEMLCEIKADIRALEEAIRNEGFTIEAGSGGRKAHPAMKSLQAARSQAKVLLNQFGLLPDSSTRQARQFSKSNYRSYYA